MTNEQYYEAIIHTAHAEVPALKDENAAQFIMKMATLGATVTFRWADRTLIPLAETPVGDYTFVFSNDGEELVVEQVL